ncbi:hypothetical protein [Sphingorhabdus sp.]|uniref:hypothetical protein n=1 Tax=Sphingorhabdus sp. TaxID=1902408 RepID=UPI00391BA2E7
MNTPEMTSALGFGTLIIALIIAVILLLRFLRKPENRHPMDGQPERNIQQIRDDAERGTHRGPVDEHRTRN